MKLRVGNIVVLALIVIAGLGLYFAYVNKDIAKLPAGTTGATLAELWETNWEGHTHPPGMSWCPKCGSLTSAQPAPTTQAGSSATTAATKRPYSDYLYAKEYQVYPGKAVVDNDKYLILVNSNHALPARHSVKTEVCVTVYPEMRQMETQAARQYKKMYDAALEDGIELIPFSAYRSTAQQKEAFDGEISALVEGGLGRQEAIERAMLTIQPPCCSEHETGLAIDITRKGVWRTDPGFADSKEFEWLQKNAHKYGFILRYPSGKEAVTGITYEPWHWRYVGVGPATEMKQSGKCLEEYLGLQ